MGRYHWVPLVSDRSATSIQAVLMQLEAPIGSMGDLSPVAVVVVIWALCRLAFVVAVKISLGCPHQEISVSSSVFRIGPI